MLSNKLQVLNQLKVLVTHKTKYSLLRSQVAPYYVQLVFVRLKIYINRIYILN